MKSVQLYTLALAAFFTVALLTAYTNNTKESGTPDERLLPQMVKAVDLDKPFDFAGEALPMDNFDVRERLDRELTVNAYWHSNTMLNIKKAHRFFPYIEQTLRKNGIPDDFKFVAVAESDLRNVTSYAGAKGFWQFMEPVAKQYGLEVSREVDERYHFEKATQAACELIQDYKDHFGTWTLAAAAYNVGFGNMDRSLERQNGHSFYDLNLNPETNRYIFRLVAIKEILSHPREFGFYLEEEELYPPLDEFELVEVNSAVESLADFADEYDISYRMLKVYNPWLISEKLTNAARKTYYIKIPRKKF